MDGDRAVGAGSRNFHVLEIVLNAFCHFARKFWLLLRSTPVEVAVWKNCDNSIHLSKFCKSTLCFWEGALYKSPMTTFSSYNMEQFILFRQESWIKNIKILCKYKAYACPNGHAPLWGGDIHITWQIGFAACSRSLMKKWLMVVVFF